MDFALYDRRARRVRWALASCLIVSSIGWYFSQSDGRLALYAHALTWAFMAGLGLYTIALIAELRDHAGRMQASDEDARQVARRDQLTNVLNRATFLKTLHRDIRISQTAAPVALFLLDLDRFKAMNDVFGHAFGDAVLKHVGHILIREIGPEAAGRLGGDEFAFVLTGPVSRSTCEAVGARVLKALREPVMLLGRTTTIEASIGVAWSPEHDVEHLDLVSCADLALYLAKKNGRGCVACFDRDLMKEERYRRGIERELRGALLMNELEMHYQPIFDPVAAKVYALEALVRWRHPVRGYISPAEFIPVAERSSLIDQIGNWVFARVCQDAMNWPDLKIGINVSPAQLKRAEFVEMARGVLKDTGCTPKNLAIEITEGLLMDSGVQQIENLKQLRRLGMGIWLDDFGAGHSGLSYLRDFPIDVIKIDKSFVQDMRSSHENRLFVSTIAQLGSGLGKLVVAEGVETEEDLTLIRAAGCSHVQGYYFARPMPARAIATYLSSRREEQAA